MRNGPGLQVTDSKVSRKVALARFNETNKNVAATAQRVG
jgi:hypothetical protein